ncbi:MAG TPA: hypothetical protein VGF59_26715 [Bryobacteraceae bacterium]|jgi:hypothetical protein
MSPAPAPDDHPISRELQFQTAEPLPSAFAPSGKACVICKQPIVRQYYHAQGAVVCELCAQRIQSGQQAPPAVSLARAALYGAGAAIAGCILYATVAIVTGLEIGLIAIVVGVIVGKAVRRGSNGLGGRPQQILAVLLTYFAITTSYIPLFISQAMKNPQAVEQSKKDAPQTVGTAEKPEMSFGKAVVVLLLIAAAAPFLELTSGVSALISLFIIFIGLRQAWRLTARSQILVMGPYDLEAAP